MQRSVSLRSMAIWACCLFGGNVVSAAGCNADNCLRALFPTQSPAVYSSAAAFCATFTASVDTRTTDFPSKASAACGTAPARYSSACSCKPTIASTLTSSTSTASTPTCTPSRPSNDGVTNGGFECSLTPWIAQDIAGTTHSLTSPGDASASAYQFRQAGPVSPDRNTNPASLTQTLRTEAGVPYNLRFRTYFDQCTQSTGFVGVMINGQAVKTVDACDKPAGVYNDNLYQFTSKGNDVLLFEFLIGRVGATVKIDNVSAVPLH